MSNTRRVRFQEPNASQSSSARVITLMRSAPVHAPVVEITFAEKLAMLNQLAQQITELQQGNDLAKAIKIAALTSVLADEIGSLRQQVDTNIVRLNALNTADATLDARITAVDANINELLSDMSPTPTQQPRP